MFRDSKGGKYVFARPPSVAGMGRVGLLEKGLQQQKARGETCRAGADFSPQKMKYLPETRGELKISSALKVA